MAAASIAEVAERLRETNESIVEVRENTDLSVNYLDLTVDTLSIKLDQLTDLFRSNLSMTRESSETEEDRDRNLFQNLSTSFTVKIDELLQFMRGNQLDQLEQRREAARDDGTTDVSGAEDNYVQDAIEKVKEFLDDALGIAGLTVGAIAAPFVTIGAFLGELRVQAAILDRFTGGVLGKIFSPITGLFRAIGNSRVITGLVSLWKSKVQPFFVRMGQFLGLLDDAGRAAGGFGKIIRTAGTIGKALGKIFAPITALIGLYNAVTGFMEGFDEGGLLEGIKQGTIKAFDSIFGSFARLLASGASVVFNTLGFENLASALKIQVSAIVDGIYESFSGIIDTIKGVFTFDVALIKAGLNSIFSGWLDILVAPVNLAYSAIKDLFSFVGIELPNINFGQLIRDVSNSAFDWIKEQLGFSAEQMPSITDVAMGIITAPADLVRSAAGWITNSLGFDGLSDRLESFSFADMYRSVVDTVLALFTNAKDWIVNKFTSFSVGDFVGNVTDSAADFLKGVLRSVLPNPSKDYGLLDPAGWAAKAIPDGIYEFAGLNPETGEVLKAPDGSDSVVEAGSQPTRVAAGTQLQREAEVRRDAEIEQASARSAAVAPSATTGGVNVSTNVQNNSQGVIRQKPSAVGQPDNVSDTMINGWAAP